MSLFIVRKCLKFKVNIIVQLLLAVCFALLTVLFMYNIGFLVVHTYIPGMFDIQDRQVDWDRDWSPSYAFALNSPTALLVHLWLPAFALGALILRVLKPFFNTVKWMQWFIKRGVDHPFEAVGLTVAIFNFFAVAIVEIAHRITG